MGESFVDVVEHHRVGSADLQRIAQQQGDMCADILFNHKHGRNLHAGFACGWCKLYRDHILV